MWWRIAALAACVMAQAFSGTAIHLKTRIINTGQSSGKLDSLVSGSKEKARYAVAPQHLVVQFDSVPTPGLVQKLAEHGVRVLGYIPENAAVVTVNSGSNLENLGLRWAGALEPGDKISPELKDGAPVLVEFHPDIDQAAARWIVNQSGARLLERTDLSGRHLLVRATRGQVRAIAAADEVAYVFPASDAAVRGDALLPCASALTAFGPTGQYAAVNSEGWDGAGLGSVSLHYVLPPIPTNLPSADAKAEIVRAFNIWSKYVQVSWLAGSDPNGRATVNVSFVSGDHGDGYPFDGPGGLLAHTFYPPPLTSEPLAGDMHLDSDEAWRIGFYVDLFSVVLHETGHALGLAHSDDPNSIMYPYYRQAADLTDSDIAAIRQLYAARAASATSTIPVTPITPTAPTAPTTTTPTTTTGTTPAAPTKPAAPTTPTTTVPLTIAILSIPATVSSETFTFHGMVAGGSGSVSVTWTVGARTGTASGASSWTASVPLTPGANRVVFTGKDSTGGTASATISVTRTTASTRQPTPAGSRDVTAPKLVITSPSSSMAAVSGDSITVTGTASDNVALRQIVWSTSAGVTGTAAGTGQWTAGPIPLITGTNTIVIRAYDTSGNSSWRSLVISKR